MPQTRRSCEMTVRLPAPAKLNLRLKITGLRSDGYHLLEMVNVTLDLCDEIILSRREEPGIGLQTKVFENLYAEAADLQDSGKNLASRAGSAFLDEFGLPGGMEITLEKRIPCAAGLGGGSSDAAAVLTGATKLYRNSLCGQKNLQSRITRLAIALGADVPFFLIGGICLVRGAGEKVTPLNGAGLRGLKCLLVKPDFGCGTREVYSAWDRLSAANPPACDAQKLPDYPELTPASLPALICNDLSLAACQLHPALGRLLEELRSIPGCLASLTGSGSCIFVLSTDEGRKSSAGDFYEEAASLAARHGARLLKASFRC